ncbi:MAG: quinone-interacting membrane-bound oxidoreductase complex subunit QmoC [Candidatus Latescibacterota bacterium]|nr:MAG: quinone-interacting membrane-bound oxidoreductase complex subunit QmoC [Candidatus Latescibacterota bacterium]
METAEKTSNETPELDVPASPSPTLAPSKNGHAVRIEPDLNFIRELRRRSRDSYKKCIQCGTCSATCTISPDKDPFPRKEMAWAVWGMKDLLVRDPDIWLCYQCSDCSVRCPRGARPGDILAGVRQEAIRHFAAPRFLGKWVSSPRYLPILLGLPAVMLGLLLYFKNPIADALGIGNLMEGRIVYSYSSTFPHWMLNAFFFFFSMLAVVAVITGVVRLWRAMKFTVAQDGSFEPVKGIWASIGAALKSVVAHDYFSTCTAARSRYLAHVCFFFGFLALTMVTIWVITSGFNALTGKHFSYPFNFWNPWKMLANIGGAAVLFGCGLTIRDRLVDDKDIGHGSYGDWALVLGLFFVVVSGFATELLHYVRLEPHRHIVYFIHLIFVFALLIYLPYSKFAHIIYRATAMVFAEHTGRRLQAAPPLEELQEITQDEPAVETQSVAEPERSEV